MCLTGKNFGLQEENINIYPPNHRGRPLSTKTGWGTTERERHKIMDRKREKEGGRMHCFMKKMDTSLV